MTYLGEFDGQYAPVVLFLFNRPEFVARVFEVIARVRPRRLLLVADGPRPDVASDRAKCEAARHVVERIDWPCTVSRNYSDVNLGCGRRLASGLDWVFDTVDRAIILEDDCLPDPSFFAYASLLLDRYVEHEQVLHISGASFGGPPIMSYFFSRFPFIWGWATWRRAWRPYDIDMTDWPVRRESDWLRMYCGATSAKYWRALFDHIYAKNVDTWDLQWMYSCWIREGLSIIPSVNLVSNLGVGGGATHMADVNLYGHLAHRPVKPMRLPLRHPPMIRAFREVDAFIQASWAHCCPLEKVLADSTTLSATVSTGGES